MKRKSILLGHADGTPVHIDISTLLRTRMFISSSSGGGKSETLRHLIEELSAADVQCLVIDPEGEYSTLREKLPFVLVGEGGETPAHPRTAGQVALTLLKLGASAVCDIYELKGSGRHEFIANFINAIVDAPKELWRPVVIVIDEAHTYAPENGYGESVAKQPIIDLCNLGRKRGFCPILATQRASKISKNASEPLQNFLIGLTMPDDQKRVCDIFKVAPGAPTREFSAQLETLEPGEFFARGAAVSKLPVLVAVERAITSPPKTGSSAAARVIATPNSIKPLLPTLADIPQEVERKAETEKSLRKRITELEQTVRDQKKTETLASRHTITPERERMLVQQIEIARKTATAYERGMEKIFGETVKIDNAMASMKAIITELREKGGGEYKAQGATWTPLTPRPTPLSSDTKPKPTSSPESRNRAPAVAADGEALSNPEQRILNALAWFAALGIEAPQNTAVAFMAGYTYGSGGYNNPKGRLRGRGMVEYLSGDLMRLTEAGSALAQAPELELTNNALQTAVLGKLPNPEQRILGPLLKSFPNGIDNEKLAEESGYTAGSGGFNNPRGRLRSLGLIRYEAGKSYAEALLFPEGR